MSCDEAVKSAERALRDIDADIGSDMDGGAPLETLIANLREAVMTPNPDLAAHMTARGSLADFLYRSESPASLVTFIHATDSSEGAEVGKARGAAFELLTVSAGPFRCLFHSLPRSLIPISAVTL